MGISKGTRKVGHLLIRLQHLTDLHGNLTQTLHDPQIFITVDSPLCLSHGQGNHREHRHLTSKRLGRSHTNLRSYMDIGTSIGGPGYTAADGITDTIDKGATLLGQLNGSQGIGRLTTLRDGNDHIALANHRITISEL